MNLIVAYKQISFAGSVNANTTRLRNILVKFRYIILENQADFEKGPDYSDFQFLVKEYLFPVN